MTNKLAVTVLILALGTVGIYYLTSEKGGTKIVEPIVDVDPVVIPPTDTGTEGKPKDKPIACTMDAMQCPDGSYVGRSGPKCEFVCPKPPPRDDSSGIYGTVLLGPTCPVMRDPPDPQCADRLFETKLALTTADGTKVVKLFNSDSKGAFRVSVSPGFYLIRSAPGGPVMPHCSKGEAVEVKAGSYTETVVYCDSGIR